VRRTETSEGCTLPRIPLFQPCGLVSVMQEDTGAMAVSRDPALYGPERLSNVADTMDGVRACCVHGAWYTIRIQLVLFGTHNRTRGPHLRPPHHRGPVCR
jgi:hypothetical protein